MNMNMNILEQEDAIKGAPDNLLLQEAQFPSGHLPQFLVISEIQRRKEMRDRFSAQEQQPEQSVAEQIVTEAVPQMPPQPPMGAMPPSGAMLPPQMPPEMMAVQNAPMAPPPQMMAAGGGRMPYPTMAGGGMIPPNSLVEDASKFNPESLYDMDASQMGMANPTNMGIASVLPMAGGGVVRMDEGGRIQAIKDMAYEHYYGDDDKFNYGTALLDAASIIPVAGALGFGGRAAYQVGKRLAPKLGKYLKSGALQQKLKSGISSLGRGAQRWTDPRISPLMTRAVEGPVIAGSVSPTARALSPKRMLTATALYEGILNLPRLFSEAENEVPDNADQSVIDFLEAQGYASGGIVRMQSGFQVPGSNFVSMGDPDSQAAFIGGRLNEYYQANPNEAVDPRHLEYMQAFQNSQEFINRGAIEEASGAFLDEQLSPLTEGISLDNLLADLENQNQEVSDTIRRPEVPVLQTGAGDREIPSFSDLVTPDQDTELQTARERLTGLMGQEVEPYDPTELLLKSQERSDKRALSEALIALGAGISRGDISSGFEGAGKSVASIKDRQELLEQQLETRRGEGQAQAQRDRIARDIAIAEVDIGAIESDKDRQDALIGMQIQYENLLLDATNAKNDAAIQQFTVELAANKFLQDQFEFNKTLAANFLEQEQLNYRQQLATLNSAFEDVQSAILKKSQLAKEDGTMPTWPEVQAELEAARKSIFGQIVALKDQGTDYELPEEYRNIGSGEIEIISTRSD